MMILNWDLVTDDWTKKCSISKNGFARVQKHFKRSPKWSHFGNDTLVIPRFGDRVLYHYLLVDREGLKRSTVLVFPLFHKKFSVVGTCLGIFNFKIICSRQMGKTVTEAAAKKHLGRRFSRHIWSIPEIKEPR